MGSDFDPFQEGQVMSGRAIREYVDNQVDQSLDFKQVMIDSKEITMSFDYPTTEILLDKMNKKTLEVFLEHLKDLQLHVEKRLFEKA